MSRKVFRFFFCLRVLCLLATACAVRAEDSIYTVNVLVDVTRPSSLEAKEDALIQGPQQAFQKLLKRLSLTEASIKNLKEFSSDRIQDYIKSFSVKNEQHSHVRYMATMIFDFDAQKIQGVLEKHQISFSEIGMLRLVVLPILIKDGHLILWDEDDNFWYKTWLSLGESKEDLHIVCPLGDLEDQILCPLQDIAHLEKSMLKGLKDRYRCDDVLLTILSLDTDPSKNGFRGYVRYLPFALKDLKDTHGMEPFSLPEEGRDSVLNPLRDKILSEIEEQWISVHAKDTKANRVIQFKIMAKAAAEWEESLKKIKSLSMVKEVTIHSLSREENMLWVSFKGEVNSLKEKLLEEGFKVDVRDSLVVLFLEKEHP